MDYLLKASAIIILFYVCYKLFLQRETYFQSNRWFLLIGLFLATVLPLIVIPIYIEYTPVPISFSETTNFVPQSNQTQTTTNIDLWQILLATYLVGTLILFGKVMLQFLSLNKLLKKHKKTKQQEFIFIETEDNIAPFSFFNHIVFNANQFTEDELEHVIIHEKIHVKQFHSIDVILIQIATILLWFNPFIWWYKKALHQNLEFIADHETQNKIDCIKSYQNVLLKTSLSQNQLALPTNFYQSLIKKRIIMLQKSKSTKSSYFKLAIILPFLGLFLMSFNVEEVYVVKAEATTNEVKTEVFTITSKSSDNDIKVIKYRLEAQTDGLKIRFSDIKHNSSGQITNLSIETKSKDKTDFHKHITYKHKEGKPIGNISLSVKNGELIFGYDDFGMNMKVTKEGQTTVLTESTSKSKKEEKKKEAWNISYETYTIDEDGTKSESKSYTPPKELPLYVVNGKIINKNEEAFDNINPNQIQSVNVLKDKKATDKYGKDGENGVVEIITKTTTTKNELQIEDNYFYILDGKEISKSELLKVYSKETMSSINVLKSKEAIVKYGIKGINGVVEVTSKDKNTKNHSEGKTYIFTSKVDSVNLKKALIKYPNGDTNASQTTYSNSLFSNDSTLIIINGKKVDIIELKKLNPVNIKSMNVLRGQTAKDAYGSVYGTGSKNDVIEITTKNKSPWRTKYEANNKQKDSIKKDSPWTIGQVEVSSIIYIDDEDPSKSESTLNISKKTTEVVLNQHKTSLKNQGIDLQYATIKRNRDGEIVKIKISVEDKNGKKSKVTYQSNKGINPIEIKLNGSGGINISSK